MARKVDRAARSASSTTESAADAAGVADASVGRVLAGQDAIRQWQEDVYRQFHRHPELSNQEVHTAATAADTLLKAGYEVHDKVGTTGVVGILRNGDGPTVLMRADMDALPMKEETGLPYASSDRQTDSSDQVVPVAHSCGHDVHVASLMGAARLLAANRSAWHGTFIPLFQPAEEVGTGAEEMVKGGLVDLIPKPDIALAQHVLAYPSGTVGTHAGPFLSTAASMRVTVHGRGSHGSMPQLSIDPVVLASMIVVRLQAIVAREVAPDDFAVLTVGRIAAGTKSNIIPDHAVIELNIRAYSDSMRTQLIDAIKRVVKGECAASGSPYDPEFELYDEYPLTSNNPEVTAKVAAAFKDYFGDRAFTVPRQSASEDFSRIPDALGVPYTFWALGGIDAAKWHKAEAAGRIGSDIPGNHSPKFAPVIEPTLQTGTAAIVVATMAWLASPAGTVAPGVRP
ncbi:MAG TPA: amidohydrolase [Chloroflexia bacterium]|nr:amidohydrolase [Chloroflexia bacterium]